MQQDLKKFQRRPFLLPLLLPVLLTVMIVAVGIWVLDARSNTVVIVLREAEVESSEGPDPNLSLAGRERAARLARVWGQSEAAQKNTAQKIDAIFAVDTRRAQQTVTPLAEALGLPINVTPTANWDELIERLQRDHRGQVLLLAADPALASRAVNELADVEIAIDAAEYDAMHIIFLPRIARTRLLSLHF
jgi:phosphohistidine phosphatase SixA